MYQYVFVCALAVIAHVKSKCPTSERDWRKREISHVCGIAREYHCLKNEKNYTEEMCIEARFLPANGLLPNSPEPNAQVSYRYGFPSGVLYPVDMIIHKDSKCPTTKQEWNERAATFVCNGDMAYHCLQTASGSTTDICYRQFHLNKHSPCIKDNERKIVCKNLALATYENKLVCPILFYGRIIPLSCYQDGCPDSPYFTDELYNYPICYGEQNEMTILVTTGSTGYTEDFLTERTESVENDIHVVTLSGTDTYYDGRHGHHVSTHILITSMVVNVFILVLISVAIRVRGTTVKEIHYVYPQKDKPAVPMAEMYDFIHEF